MISPSWSDHLFMAHVKVRKKKGRPWSVIRIRAFFPEGSKLDPDETGDGDMEPLRAGPGPDLGSDNSKL